MAAQIHAATTERGQPGLRDRNLFSHVKNGNRGTTTQPAYDTTPREDYLAMIAAELAKED